MGLGWPNIVSVARVLLAPVVVALLLARTRTASWLAAAVFVLGAATDGLDGWLARRFRSTSRTGMWLDPLADKIIVAAAVLTLSAQGRFPVWATVVILLREVGISILRITRGLRGASMPASRGAKLKTLFQLGAITLYIIPVGSGAHDLRVGVLWVAVALTVVTGAMYLVEAQTGSRSGRRGGA